MPAALPSTIDNLKALESLNVGDNALTGLCFCITNRALTTSPAVLPESIGQLEALTDLRLFNNQIEGEHSRSTNCASDPSHTCACSIASHERLRRAHGD